MISSGSKGRVGVVGAGIVGLCTAYYLRKAGCEVVVIDREAPGSQCSSGNAGALSARSVAPLAMPGIIRTAIKMMMDPTGPLYLPPTYMPYALPWLLRFIAASKPPRVAQIAGALAGLLAESVPLHRALARDIGCPQRVGDSGQLHLYPDEAALAKDAGSWALRMQHGETIERLDRAAIRDMEPAVDDGYRVGLFLPDAAWVSQPFRYASAVADKLREMGVVIVQDDVRGLTRDDDGWTIAAGRESHRVDEVVVAAGAWSAKLLGTLGVKVPLETQRGYHLSIPEPGLSVSRVVVLADRKVFITPMEDGLRVAGTVEYGGLTRAPNAQRAALLGDHAKAGLRQLNLSNGANTWMGHRPCLPDSMPVIGEVPSQPGLWTAFGHGHLGLTGSAPTGKLLADVMTGAASAEKLAPFSVARF
jgi:D-amino-acid dehydrogenase